MARPSYSTELMDYFEAVNARLENGLQVCRDVSAFYKKKAALEETYAKGLIELCKQVPSAGGLGGLFARGPPALDKEGATLRGAILSVQEETGKIATKHLDFANKINTDVCAPLELFIKSKEAEKKKLVADAQRYLKNYKDTQAAAVRARDNYHKLSKEFETAKDELLKLDSAAASDPKKKPQVDKAAARVTDLENRLDAAIKAYQEAITKANETQATYFSTELPTVLSQLQEMDESRFATLSSAVQCYYIHQGTISAFIDEKSKDMSKHLDAANSDADLKDFIDKTKATPAPAGTAVTPGTVTFDTYKSKYPETLPKELRGADSKPSEAIAGKQINPAPPVVTSSTSSSSLSSSSSSVTTTTAAAAPPSPAPVPASTSSASPATTAASEAPQDATPPRPARPANRDLFKGLFGDDAESDIFSDKPKTTAPKGGNDFDDLLSSINENETKLFAP